MARHALQPPRRAGDGAGRQASRHTPYGNNSRVDRAGRGGGVDVRTQRHTPQRAGRGVADVRQLLRLRRRTACTTGKQEDARRSRARRICRGYMVFLHLRRLVRQDDVAGNARHGHRVGALDMGAGLHRRRALPLSAKLVGRLLQADTPVVPKRKGRKRTRHLRRAKGDLRQPAERKSFSGISGKFPKSLENW